MLRQYIDPLAWAFDLQHCPRLPGKRLPLVLLLILTLHLIGVSGGIIYGLVHLDPIHMHHADRPGQALGLVLIHRFVSSFQRAACRKDSCSPCSKTFSMHVWSSIACWG